MEKVAVVVFGALMIVAILVVLYCSHIIKIYRRFLEERDAEVEAKTAELSKLRVRVNQEAETNAELAENNKKLEYEKNECKVQNRILEAEKSALQEEITKLNQKIIDLNRELQEKDDYMHWVGTTALATNEEYTRLLAEKEKLETELRRFQA